MQIGNVVVAHADASRGHIEADRPRLWRAMDAVDRILITFVEIKRARAERIVRAARHAASPFARLLVTLDHFGRWRPSRPFRHAADADDTRPAEAVPADADAIADRRAAGLYQ